jgi:hypothetical protein
MMSDDQAGEGSFVIIKMYKIVYRSCQQVPTGYGTGEYTLPICWRGNKKHKVLFGCQKKYFTTSARVQQ